MYMSYCYNFKSVKVIVKQYAKNSVIKIILTVFCN